MKYLSKSYPQTLSFINSTVYIAVQYCIIVELELTLCLSTPTVLTAVDTFCHFLLFCAHPGREVEPRRSSLDVGTLVRPENFSRNEALL